MFKRNEFSYQYAPILSMSRSEMVALKELPNKEKDLILPVFPLRGWAASKLLKNSIETISKSIGNRKWIADIDPTFISDYEKKKEFKLSNEYPRDVFREIKALLDPSSGYAKWVDYVASIPNAIPTLQIGDLTQIDLQIKSFELLGRGLVVRIPMTRQNPTTLRTLIEKCRSIDDVFLILDYGDISHVTYAECQNQINLFESISKILPDKISSFSATSFPYSFPSSEYGEVPIFERLIYNKIKDHCLELRTVYSDRASSRAERMSGGAGTPPPRIDYPLKHDWRYIRREFNNSSDVQDGEKNELYTSIAKEMLDKNYWIKGLALWGTQMIQKTAVGDSFGITSAASATAVRINIHIYQQLHYDVDITNLDTEEDWED